MVDIVLKFIDQTLMSTKFQTTTYHLTSSVTIDSSTYFPLAR
jgi:hypothetical protein